MSITPMAKNFSANFVKRKNKSLNLASFVNKIKGKCFMRLLIKSP